MSAVSNSHATSADLSYPSDYDSVYGPCIPSAFLLTTGLITAVSAVALIAIGFLKTGIAFALTAASFFLFREIQRMNEHQQQKTHEQMLAKGPFLSASSTSIVRPAGSLEQHLVEVAEFTSGMIEIDKQTAESALLDEIRVNEKPGLLADANRLASKAMSVSQKISLVRLLQSTLNPAERSQLVTAALTSITPEMNVYERMDIFSNLRRQQIFPRTPDR